MARLACAKAAENNNRLKSSCPAKLVFSQPLNAWFFMKFTMAFILP